MFHKPRIFISTTGDQNLNERRCLIKNGIIKTISEAGFEPQMFFESGLPIDKAWNFDTVSEVMKRCQGAAILGLHRSTIGTDNSTPTEFNHYEGALALAQRLPTLIVAERETPNRGIFFNGGGQIIAYLTSDADVGWLNSEGFKVRFNSWRNLINNQYEVFLGYSSAAQSTADAIVNFLRGRLGVSVKEYSTGFQKGGTILEEIEQAAQQCLCGIFLLTRDDQLASHESQFTPRDNVLFEAGYFMNAKGKERTLIIREEGVKMPADIGGNIYLPLKDRSDISTIREDLRFFLESRL